MPGGLIYYPDSMPGIARKRSGRGFSYVAPDGTTIARGAERRRLEAMAIPPAYEDVWMTPKPNGHLMATGYDARRRKQYRYHPDWALARAETKYESLAGFGHALPVIRAGIAHDLRARTGSERFALAAAALLIDELAVRVGTASYAAENNTYGATTLRRRHLRLVGGALRLSWVAKGGKRVTRTIRDRRLMRALTRARDLPGTLLFTWIDDEGEVRPITSQGLNAYLADLGEGPFTSKVFRTWSGTLAAFEAHRENPSAGIGALAAAAAERLGNTPAVARESYIHPKVLDLVGAEPAALPAPLEGLSPAETGLLALLD
ncbi:DNA topoisomerase IB [Amaricoccus solimangrovi]|uniref:DNA topoisomerase n=2 Tax=Amaricoccus solimangrovi TaxID=2589815 RepID=A0A501WXS1_9RHOB|nr:DNA topoisomerase IB [Amaricoccus solimangrovi]